MNNLYLNQIKQQGKEEELLCLLQYYFGGFHQFKFDDKANISAFVYSTSTVALDVSLSKNGKIAKIKSYLSTKDIKILESNIQDAILNDHGNKIGQAICFVTGKVETYYRCDYFQILPVPASASKPKAIQNYPFLFQFIYPTSPNWQIDQMRRRKWEQQYINLLTLFLHSHIMTNILPSSPFWTFDIGQQPEEHFSGYFYPEFAPTADEFCNTCEYQQNPSIPANDYYTGILAFRVRLLAE